MMKYRVSFFEKLSLVISKDFRLGSSVEQGKMIEELDCEESGIYHWKLEYMYCRWKPHLLYNTSYICTDDGSSRVESSRNVL